MSPTNQIILIDIIDALFALGSALSSSLDPIKDNRVILAFVSEIRNFDILIKLESGDFGEEVRIRAESLRNDYLEEFSD